MLIEELIDGTRDENGAQRFVYLRDKGVIVDIERCTDLDLIKAANQQLTEELAETEEELTEAHRRMAELEAEQ